MRLINILLFCLTITSCGQTFKNLLEPESKTTGTQTSTSALKWPTNRYPIKLVFPESARSQIEVSVINVISDWNYAANLPLLTYEFQDYPIESQGKVYLADDSEYRIYFQSSTNWNKISNDNSALAITFFKYYGGDILSADIVFNMGNPFGYSENIPTNVFDFYTVLSHEVGHFIGEGHITEESSVMYPSLFIGQKRRTISPNDMTRIRNRYGSN